MIEPRGSQEAEFPYKSRYYGSMKKVKIVLPYNYLNPYTGRIKAEKTPHRTKERADYGENTRNRQKCAGYEGTRPPETIYRIKMHNSAFLYHFRRERRQAPGSLLRCRIEPAIFYLAFFTLPIPLILLFIFGSPRYLMCFAFHHLNRTAVKFF
jgi:hypothetical protein